MHASGPRHYVIPLQLRHSLLLDDQGAACEPVEFLISEAARYKSGRTPQHCKVRQTRSVRLHSKVQQQIRIADRTTVRGPRRHLSLGCVFDAAEATFSTLARWQLMAHQNQKNPL